ncbi:MAG TPA: DNA repair protein RecO [Gemmatimonadales bacterium]|nr:DNA repair protein RecO [Gemmatimonadales bacterium]
MSLVMTPAIVLSALRYSETSKIVRLATRELGVQSAIAKGALRPKSRFGASLQVLSDGQAHLLVKEHRELHTLAAFDLTHLRVGLTAQLDRYAAASALAEVMLRFAPPAPNPESFDVFRHALALLEVAPPAAVEVLGLRMLWRLVSVLGFAPSLDACVRDGTPVALAGALAFSTREGGALCERCAADHGATRLPDDARADLRALLAADAELPALDERHAQAHQRLLSRYIRFHLGEGAELPALDFWVRRPWASAPAVPPLRPPAGS